MKWHEAEFPLYRGVILFHYSLVTELITSTKKVLIVPTMQMVDGKALTDTNETKMKRAM